jgi:hypothetical protein
MHACAETIHNISWPKYMQDVLSKMSACIALKPHTFQADGLDFTGPPECACKVSLVAMILPWVMTRLRQH